MFRTELSIAPATGQLPRTARVLTLGSCFADSIGARLVDNKVEALVNPFGTVFQPLALGRLLRAAAGEEVDWQQHLVEARGRWQSYDLHGSVGAESPVELLQHIQELVRRTGDFLRQADVVLITLGTAWAYRLRETGELVNNCHKQPADLFVRELLTPDDIINALAETHAYLRRLNPELRFVLTVSPVRHLKDTLPLNSVSKSVLRLATHIVSELLPGVAYFPAYELLMDDLRDYRFYAADMLHPSEQAEDYVWDKFARTYFDAEFGRFRKEWTTVRQSLSHRPLHAGAPEHRHFLESTLAKLEQLSLRRVDVDAELVDVRSQLAALPELRQPTPVASEDDDEERVDIGEASPATITFDAVAAPPAAEPPHTSLEGHPARLSPEEFRSQRAARTGRPERGRRDGRGKSQAVLPTENEQYQAQAPREALPETLLPESLAADALEVAKPNKEDGAAGTLGFDALIEDAGKKKKRRSRGGAKRTARKNALRLAAGESDEGTSTTSPEVPLAPATLTENPTASAVEQPEDNVTALTADAKPVKRGGRRNESNRVPRQQLFVAPDTKGPEAAPLGVVETSATSDSPAPVVETAAGAQGEQAESSVSSRNNRNRNGRGVGKDNNRALSKPAPAALAAESLPGLTATAPSEASATLAITPDQATSARKQSRGVASQPETGDSVVSASATETASEATEERTPVAAAARRQNRPKRAVSAARAEKPAIDTPVVPVPDALDVRTQVAAGRMTGSSASLVAPTAAKTSVPKKALTAKKNAVNLKGNKSAAATIAPVNEVVPPPAALVGKAKPAPKTKPAAAKPAAVKKPIAKVTVAKPVVANTATPKPKSPRKPVKPA